MNDDRLSPVPVGVAMVAVAALAVAVVPQHLVSIGRVLLAGLGVVVLLGLIRALTLPLDRDTPVPGPPFTSMAAPPTPRDRPVSLSRVERELDGGTVRADAAALPAATARRLVRVLEARIQHEGLRGTDADAATRAGISPAAWQAVHAYQSPPPKGRRGYRTATAAEIARTVNAVLDDVTSTPPERGT